jgi:hypothetical protein
MSSTLTVSNRHGLTCRAVTTFSVRAERLKDSHQTTNFARPNQHTLVACYSYIWYSIFSNHHIRGMTVRHLNGFPRLCRESPIMCRESQIMCSETSPIMCRESPIRTSHSCPYCQRVIWVGAVWVWDSMLEWHRQCKTKGCIQGKVSLFQQMYPSVLSSTLWAVSNTCPGNAA